MLEEICEHLRITNTHFTESSRCPCIFPAYYFGCQKGYLYLRDGPFFRTDFSIRTTLKFWWVSGSREMACSNCKVKKSVGPKIIVFLCKTIKELRVYFWRRILGDRTLSEHLNHNHHEGNNIGTYKRGRCPFMMHNPERCTDLFVVMFKLEDGWVSQNQSERCSNLEICMEKSTIP